MKQLFKPLTVLCLCIALCLSSFPLWASSEQIVAGDMNDDGETDMIDVLYIFNHVNGNITLTAEQLALADLTGDGQVLLHDVMTVFYLAINIPVDYVMPDPTTTTTVTTTKATTSTTKKTTTTTKVTTTTKKTTTTTKATTTTTKKTTTTTKVTTTTTKKPTTTTTKKTTTTTTTRPTLAVRKGVTKESVYMNDIKVKNETTGKTFTAETKAKLQMAVAEIVKYEMGMSTFGEKSSEAWKAMAVAAYTEIARYCYGEGDASYTYYISMSEDINLNNATDKRIYNAVGEVLGIKIAYNDSSLSALDQLCEVFYGASNAGVTCSTYNVWGYGNLEYIPVVESVYDNAEWIDYCSAGIDTFEHTFTISVSELLKCTAQYGGVSLSKVGYVTRNDRNSLYATEKEGPYWGTTNFYYLNSDGTRHYMTGVDLYYAINWYHPSIHCYSHAMRITNEKSGGIMTITTKGNGHGLGLSQYGAAGYANEAGWTYDQILAHYFGITSKTAWGLVGPKW